MVTGNPDIKNVVLFTMSEDESQENTTELLQDRLEDMGLHLLKIVDIRQGASDEDYAYYAIQALNQGTDGYIFLVRGKETGNILLKLRSHGVEEGRQILLLFPRMAVNCLMWQEICWMAFLSGINLIRFIREKTGSNCCRIIGSPVMERSRCRIRWQIIMIR